MKQSVEDHPVWKMPSAEMAGRYAALKGVSHKEAWLELEQARLEKIKREQVNPLQYGYEPPIWRVCDSLLGLDWILDASGYEGYGPKMREALGFKEPLDVLLINGGNRAGKSEYASKRMNQCLLARDKVVSWCFHTDGDMSVQYQQPLIHKYLPPALRDVDVKSSTTYVSYKLKTGFSDGAFILPNLSFCDFRNYRMDKQKIEGGELGDPEKFPVLGVWADELIPEDWVETLLLRLATRNAKMVITFTPVNGYNGTVKLFQEAGTVAKWCRALLCPKDGMERSAFVCRQENCDAWIGQGPEEDGLGVVESGRVWDRVPRVIRSGDAGLGVVFFHSSDNPYGNPSRVVRAVGGKPFSFVKERFYGFAERMNAGAFPLFSAKVHVVRAKDVPPLNQMTLYHFVDPCGGRNFFMGWFGVDAAGRRWMFREWPNQHDFIPGVGVMPPWAHTCGDMSRLDGRIGKGQESLGWGLAQYKKEIARLEGWSEWDVMAESRDVVRWVGAKARESVFMRFLDARFANVKTFEEGGMESLFDKFSEIGLEFFESESNSRDSIRDGVALINDALCYDPNRPADINNQPSFFISEECENTLFAMQLWTGKDGQKGATKDPIDVVRMFFLKQCGFVDPAVGGGYAGRGCY